MTSRGRSILKALTQLKEHLDGRRALKAYQCDIPDPVDVKAIRQRAGLSQAKFAARYAISPRTLQEWEQGRTVPDSAVRAYLMVIDRNPRAVQEALEGS
jgi:putative transcriptional regulator